MADRIRERAPSLPANEDDRKMKRFNQRNVVIWAHSNPLSFLFYYAKVWTQDLRLGVYVYDLHLGVSHPICFLAHIITTIIYGNSRCSQFRSNRPQESVVCPTIFEEYVCSFTSRATLLWIVPVIYHSFHNARELQELSFKALNSPSPNFI